MFTHGTGPNGHLHRESEVMSRLRSLSKHIRDPDKVEHLWDDTDDADHTRTTLRRNITKENLFLKMFPDAPKVIPQNAVKDIARAQSTGNLLQKTYCSGSKTRKLTTARKPKLIKPAKYHFGKLYEVDPSSDPVSKESFTTRTNEEPKQPFKPAGWMQARNEIAENNYLLFKEYYLREKDLKFEEWQKSKAKWMGPPFISNRKNNIEPAGTKKSRNLLNKNQINRIITKNYVKNNDDGMSILDSEDSKYGDIKDSNKNSNYASITQLKNKPTIDKKKMMKSNSKTQTNYIVKVMKQLVATDSILTKQIYTQR